MAIWPVADARKANLPSIFGKLRPFAPRSRMKPRMTPSSVLAQTTAISAMGALVIQLFEPDSRNPPSTARARVTMLPGSEPWSGSVNPKQPTSSPEARPGKYLLRCAAVPKA